MSNDLLTTQTTIKTITDKGQQVMVQDTEGNTYSFFKTKKDGSSTLAASTLQGFRAGDSIEIVYKEVPYNGRNLKSVVKFKPTTSAASPRPASTVATVAPAMHKDEVIGVLALMKVTGATLQDLEDSSFWQRYIKSYRLGMQVIKGQTQEVLPVIQVDSNINEMVEDIPF